MILAVRVAVWAIVLVVLTGVAWLVFTYWRFAGEIEADVARLVAQAGPAAGSTIDDEMLAALPAPARRYFAHAGIVGTKIPKLVRLTQIGKIRSSLEAGWMGFVAAETYSTSAPAFVWHAYFPSPLMPIVLGRDEYLEGRGSIVMKMLAAIPVADERGDELAAAGLMRYLNEMMWFPAAFLGSNVTISPVDDESFAVSVADRGMVAEAVLFVDAEGQLTNFRARRYNTGSRRMETWETPITGYARFNDLLLPSVGSAIWKLEDGDLDYIELEVTGVTYAY